MSAERQSPWAACVFVVRSVFVICQLHGLAMLAFSRLHRPTSQMSCCIMHSVMPISGRHLCGRYARSLTLEARRIYHSKETPRICNCCCRVVWLPRVGSNLTENIRVQMKYMSRFCAQHAFRFVRRFTGSS